MQLKELLKINFKQPGLNQEEVKLEEKKRKILKSLEKCYSSLESVEILNSSTKNEDSAILIRHLAIDSANLILDLFDRQPITEISKITDSLKTIPEPSIISLIEKNAEILGTLQDSDLPLEKCEEAEGFLSRLLSETEKIYQKKKGSELNTPAEIYRQRIRVQSTIFVTLFAITAISFFYNWIKYPSIHKDTVQVYYTTSASQKMTETLSVKTDLNLKPDWTTYTFQLPAPTDITGIRIDPLNQKKMKIQLKSIRIFDKNKKTAGEWTLGVSEKFVPTEFRRFTFINQIKSGKNIPGGFMTIVTEGDDPFLHFNTGEIRGVSSVEVTFRAQEDFKKFKD
ncbi:MAG: hypothetical protein K8R21_05410 [Leptospira sp.]|nr:hypothetical protein [Leptospira sp.]